MKLFMCFYINKNLYMKYVCACAIICTFIIAKLSLVYYLQTDRKLCKTKNESWSKLKESKTLFQKPDHEFSSTELCGLKLPIWSFCCHLVDISFLFEFTLYRLASGFHKGRLALGSGLVLGQWFHFLMKNKSSLDSISLWVYFLFGLFFSIKCLVFLFYPFIYFQKM